MERDLASKIAQNARRILQESYKICDKELERKGKAKEKMERHSRFGVIGKLHTIIPESYRKDECPIIARYFERVAEAFELYAKAIENGYKLQPEDNDYFVLFSFLVNLPFQFRLLVQRNLNLEFLDLLPPPTRVHIRGSSREIYRPPDQKEAINKMIEEEYGRKHNIPRDSAESWKPEEKRWEDRNQKLSKLESEINAIFASPDMLDAQMYPCEKYSAEHAKEIQKLISSYFEIGARVVTKMEKYGPQKYILGDPETKKDLTKELGEG